MNLLYNFNNFNVKCHILIISFVICVIFYLQVASTSTSDKDYVSELARKCNYPVEIHKNIQTKDGYLLTMHRIPGSSNIKEYQEKAEGNYTKTPVLLMHGLLGSAENFLLFDCKKSLPYMLSDQGYDVWLGNFRSVSYSRHHVDLNPNEMEFWQFTYDELVNNDLTKFIDYIIETTNMASLVYIGHSQGNLAMYMLLSNNPDYNNKVQLFINLSPIASFKNFPHPWLAKVAKSVNQLQTFTDTYGLYEWTFGRDFIRQYGSIMCSGFLSVFCKFAIYFMSGMPPHNIHTNDMQRLLINCPEGISALQFYHACQMMNKRTIQKYDYGSRELNLDHYGVEIPPKYNLSSTKCPTALYYAKHDWFLSPEAAKDVENQLANVVDSYLIPSDQFSHADFIFGWDSPKLLYPRIIALMNSINNKLP